MPSIEQTLRSDGGATAARFSGRDRVAWQEWFVEEDAWERALDAVGLRE
jgi:hypothetical protein